MIGTLGLQELLIIAGIVALIFGPRQLPRLGRSLGATIRELRSGLHETGAPEEPGKDET